MRLQKNELRLKAFRQASGLPLALRQAALHIRGQLGVAQAFGHADGEVGKHRNQALVLDAVVVN